MVCASRLSSVISPPFVSSWPAPVPPFPLSVPRLSLPDILPRTDESKRETERLIRILNSLCIAVKGWRVTVVLVSSPALEFQQRFSCLFLLLLTSETRSDTLWDARRCVSEKGDRQELRGSDWRCCCTTAAYGKDRHCSFVMRNSAPDSRRTLLNITNKDIRARMI
jgi:hypothetical protein